MKEKVTKKFKDNPNRSARLSGQRLHISQGASVTLVGLVWLRLRLVDEVVTELAIWVAFGIGWWTEKGMAR